MSLVRVIALLLGGTLFCLTSANAQQDTEAQTGAANPPLTLHSTTHMVVLDVVVTANSGKTEDKLTAGNFTILEDGVSQHIVSFEPPEMHRALLGRGREDRAAQQSSEVPRTLMVVDELDMDPILGAQARQAVKKFLHSQRTYLQQPTALLMLGNQGLELIAPYTRDPRILEQALAHHQPALPWHLMHGEGVQGAGWRFGVAIRALQQIAQASVNRHSRKNVIWLSTGFPILSTTHMFPQDAAKLRNLISNLSGMLLESRISMYIVDPRGIAAPFLGQENAPLGLWTGEDLASGDLIFERIAPETGGKIFRARNDLAKCIGEGTKDGSTYYTIAYYPSNKDWNGKFRRIQVKIDEPGMNARTRLGYYAVAETDGMSDSQIDLALSLAVKNPITYTAVTVSAEGKRHPDLPRQVDLRVKVDHSTLLWTKTPDGGERAEVTLVTAALDNDSKVVGYKVREFELTIGKGKKLKAGAPMTIAVPMDVPNKARRIRCVIRDADSQKVGTTDLKADTLATLAPQEIGGDQTN